MKNGKGRTIWIVRLLIVVWMVVIFGMSAQPAEESSMVSGSVSYRIAVVVNAVLHLNMTEDQIADTAEYIGYPVRKAAHMTEYAILAVLVLWAAVLRWGTDGWKRLLLCYGAALGAAFCYASTDEFHQRFVPGRAGLFSDVLIDTCGAFLGLMVVFVLTNWYNRKKRKKG